MNSTTEVLNTTRSKRTAQPDPTAVWGPLAGLAETASDAASESTIIAINRGFDRNARQRARALRQLLDDRGVRSVEITPAPDSEDLLAEVSVAAVVNLIGTGSWQPDRLAAKTRSIVLNPASEGANEVTRRDVIGMTRQDDSRDVALTRVAVLPESGSDGSITITRDGEPLSVPGGSVTITLHQQALDVRVVGPDFAEQRFSTDRLGVQTLGVVHRLIRDEMPIAEFEGTLDFACEPGGLVVHHA